MEYILTPYTTLHSAEIFRRREIKNPVLVIFIAGFPKQVNLGILDKDFGGNIVEAFGPII